MKLSKQQAAYILTMIITAVILKLLCVNDKYDTIGYNLLHNLWIVVLVNIINGILLLDVFSKYNLTKSGDDNE